MMGQKYFKGGQTNLFWGGSKLLLGELKTLPPLVAGLSQDIFSIFVIL